MVSYTIRQHPNINDPDLLRCCATAQQMRSTLLEFFRHIVGQLDRIPVTVPTRVALAVLNRMAEGSLSIEILCMKNRVRDAAILLLSLIELRLDLQYIALDPVRANTWIDHARDNNKPWRVASQLREIYNDSKELDAESAIYRQYSMVKHGNPVGESFSFPMAVTRKEIQLDLADDNSPWVRIHLFALGGCIHGAGQAASRIWCTQGLDVASFAHDLKNGCDTLSRLNEEHIIAVLQAEPPTASGS